MAALVVFPDVVDLLIGHLRDELPMFGGPAAVHHEVPAERPDRWVRVLRTGGVRQTLVTEAAQITLEGWADDSADAHDACQLARAVVFAATGTTIDGVPFYSVEEIGGPADLPDPDSRQQRHTCTLLVHVRGATPVASA